MVKRSNARKQDGYVYDKEKRVVIIPKGIKLRYTTFSKLLIQLLSTQ
jgi:hypothetical protein